MLFPECFLQGYFTNKESVTNLAIKMASQEFSEILEFLSDLQVTIVVGFIEKSDAGCAGTEYYNTAVPIRGGRTIYIYRKSGLLDGEKDGFDPGRERPTFEVSGQIVGINICYDLNFNTAVQPLVSKGARILVCPCNNIMPFAKAERLKTAHDDIRAQRCRDKGILLVSSDVTGTRDGRISYGPNAVIDPHGATVDQVPLMTEGMVVF